MDLPGTAPDASREKAVNRLLVVVVLLLAVNLVVELVQPRGIARSAEDPRPRFGHLQVRDRIVRPGREELIEVVDLRNGNAWGFAGYDTDPVYLGRYRLEAIDAERR